MVLRRPAWKRGRPASVPGPTPMRAARLRVTAWTRAGVSVLEPGVWEVVARCGPPVVPGRVRPALAVAMPEMRRSGCAERWPVVTIAPMEIPPLMMPWRVPARTRRVASEMAWPRLRSVVPPRVVMVHHRGAVTHHDADAERGPHILGHRVVAVRPCRRGDHGQSTQGGGEEQSLTHGSSPSEFSQAGIEPASRCLNGD